MNKVLQIIVSVLALICVILGLLGMINHTKKDNTDVVEEIKYETNGKVFELLTSLEEDSLSTLTEALVKEVTIEGQGNLKITYEKFNDGTKIKISLKDTEIYTAEGEILYNAYIFHSSIVLYLNKLDDDAYGKMLVLEKGKISNRLDNIVYNGNIYYFPGKAETITITDKSLTFKASSVVNGMFSTLTNTYEACRANNDEVYLADFSISYINKIITSPSMEETGRHTIEEYKTEQSC